MDVFVLFFFLVLFVLCLLLVLSGIRLGTSAITTRGLKPEHQPQVAEWIDRTVTAAAAHDESSLDTIAAEIRVFLAPFPIPGYSA